MPPTQGLIDFWQRSPLRRTPPLWNLPPHPFWGRLRGLIPFPPDVVPMPTTPLPVWAVPGTRLQPVNHRAKAALAWFDRAAYMRVNRVDPADKIPIHLVAYDKDNAPLGSTNLWADSRNTDNGYDGWSEDDWAIQPEPEKPSFWSRLTEDDPDV